MLKVGKIEVGSLAELMETWKKDGNRYINGDVSIEIAGRLVSVGNNVSIGNHCSIGIHAFIGNRAVIGDRVLMGSRCFIGYGTSIGSDVTAGYGVSIGNRCSVGDFCRLCDFTLIGDQGAIGPCYELPVPPIWFSGPRHSIGYYCPGMIKSGCLLNTVGWWQQNISDMFDKHNYSGQERDEYLWRLKTVVQWMKRWNVYERDLK